MHKQIQIVLYAMDIRGVSFDVVPKRFGHWVQKWEGTTRLSVYMG